MECPNPTALGPTVCEESSVIRFERSSVNAKVCNDVTKNIKGIFLNLDGKQSIRTNNLHQKVSARVVFLPRAR
ncbi:hypothetical protein BH18THE1_BH18THE1_08760 [soil metagenome]